VFPSKSTRDCSLQIVVQVLRKLKANEEASNYAKKNVTDTLQSNGFLYAFVLTLDTCYLKLEPFS